MIGEPNYLHALSREHAGAFKRAVVCGLGSSATQLTVRPTAPRDTLLVGVNDAGALYHFHAVVVTDDPRTFAPGQLDRDDRICRVMLQRSLVVTNRNEWCTLRDTMGRPTRLVLTKGGKPPLPLEFGADADGEPRMLVAMTTPISAAWLAVFLGVERIGVVGVDLLPGSVFDPFGSQPHSLDTEEKRAALIEHWRWFEAAAKARGARLYNLAPHGIEILQHRVSMEDFLR